eukprot:CAMPEP_0174241822 /NCGR_PEP_ID=MMETSP0417-20130205/25057_1 /TAXON_ID=242541 /ORGANISM="Mayorella sp, Strain BSH-02190019" /LENGTH=432 /DNA_ID=CAMNT_0015321125 /DNA_START=137 /DNA_END=1432 /DNA_ORIENTATION=+
MAGCCGRCPRLAALSKKFFREGQSLMGEDVGEPPAKKDLPAYYRWLPYGFYVQFIHKRTFLFAAGFPASLVLIFWFFYMGITDQWYQFEEGWPLTLTMLFGSFIAGASSEGGGAIAFPVMTLILNVNPLVARDFSIMIQSFGMTSASFLILYLRIRVEYRALIWSTLGGVAGVMIGLSFVAPNLNSTVIKVTFIAVWMSFVIALLIMNWGSFRGRSRKVFRMIPRFNWWKAGTLVLFGFAGGVLTSMTGSGIDLFTFSMMTLLFRISEKTATPTSVILMAINTVVAVIWQGSMYGLSEQALTYLWCAVPVAVIMAPVGAYVISYAHRLTHAVIVMVLDAIQFVVALVVIDMTGPLWGLCFGALGIGSVLWGTLGILGHHFMKYMVSIGAHPDEKALTIAEEHCGFQSEVNLLTTEDILHEPLPSASDSSEDI